jgi:hypothetical protein
MNDSTFGNPGIEVVLLKLDALSTAKNIGKNMLGAMSAGCRAISNVERLAIAMVWRIESCRLRAVPAIALVDETKDVATVMLWRLRGGDQLLLQTHHQDLVH